jgi:hypothetical protein
VTTHACPPKNAITESQYRQLVQEAGGPGMIFIDVPVIPDPPSGLAGAIAGIIDAIFPEPRFPCCEPEAGG